MRAIKVFRLLLGLLCLNQFFQEQLRASGHRQLCRTLRFQRGSIITQSAHQSYGKTWCGSESRKLLAVENGVLFFLECSSGDKIPTQATAALFYAANATPATSIFEEKDLCEVVKSKISTGQNAGALAKRLEGIVVPFDGSSCNAQHYITYLSTGKGSSKKHTAQTCPVYQEFTSSTEIASLQFKLSGKHSVYDWPKQNYGGALTISQTTQRQGSKNSMASRLYSNTSSSRNSRLGYSKSRTQKNPQAIGHLSSSGGRGSSGGGRSSSGGGGSGSRGGGEEGGEGSSGGGGARGNNYYGYGGGGRHQHSAASKPAPWWSFKLSKFSFGSGYRPKLGG